MKIVHAKTDTKYGKKNVFAADNVFEDMPDFEAPVDEDIEEEVVEENLGEDGEQDSSTVDVENNITNHLIAECENCHGIFISAMIASDQVVDSINGVCPLCNKDTEPALRWIVKDYPED